MAAFSAVVLILLCCCTTLCSALGLRRQQPLADTDRECANLAKVFQSDARPLQTQLAAPSFACHGAVMNASIAMNVSGHVDASSATCSPVCTEALDVVIALGASEWSLEKSDAEYISSSAMALLKHFELSRARGSLFGFLDVSRGARRATRISPLSDDREALLKALQSWHPLVGGSAVTSVEMQGFEQRPEVLAMLDTSRPSVRRTLLVLWPPPRKPEGSGDAQSAHLAGLQTSGDPFTRDKEIMELLVSTCPAVRIDPELACGRMRWGSAHDSGRDKIKPWGNTSK